LIDSLLQRLQKHSDRLEEKVAEKTEQINAEKEKSDSLLYQMLPQSVANRLKVNAVGVKNFKLLWNGYIQFILGFIRLTLSIYTLALYALHFTLYALLYALRFRSILLHNIFKCSIVLSQFSVFLAAWYFFKFCLSITYKITEQMFWCHRW